MSAATHKFEVISIRRHSAQNGPVQPGPPLGPTADGFHSIGLSMLGIFQWAYALPNHSGLLRGNQIEGDPKWLSDELYDVVAKVEQTDVAAWQKPEMRQTMLRAMLQAMLAERCNVVAHYGTKEVSVYDLVVAKGGPKFKAAETVDPADLRRRHPAAGIMRGGVTMTQQESERTQFYAMPMALLADTILSSLTGRPVLDKTGLAGYYDLALPSSALRPAAPRPEETQRLDPASPSLDDESIFTALTRVLGLRLEPAKGRVETLVIDHVERPSEN
jgi:uncharacterized protein (TIGR03435 family)